MHARVLGIAQDATVPHAGCDCPRCERHRGAPLLPACLGVTGERSYMIDATPAFGEQVRMLGSLPSAILLTHTHMGHIAGLLQLGPEACNTEKLEVFGTPLVCEYLRKNEPWKSLVKRRNITLVYENAGSRLDLEDGLRFESFLVPHRDEETVGYFVRGPKRTLLYVPDIDGWEGIDLSGLLAGCDLALLDGTFYGRGELARQEAVPHPTIEETLDRLSPEEAAKVRFIHLNHTNPVLDADGASALVAIQGETLPLD